MSAALAFLLAILAVAATWRSTRDPLITLAAGLAVLLVLAFLNESRRP